jgi:hypothetical protein
MKTKTAQQTAAQKISALLSDDGNTYRTHDGQTLRALVDAAGGRVQHPRSPGFEVFVFADGSAIVDAGGGWDLRADGCSEHCWAGVGCECATEAEDA